MRCVSYRIHGNGIYKVLTLWPVSRNFGSVRSRSSNLPDTRYSSSLDCRLGLMAFSTSSYTKGWLQILRSCMMVLLRPLTPIFLLHDLVINIAFLFWFNTYPSLLREVYILPFFFICWYNLSCNADNLHLMTRSTLSGSSASTSFLRRRSKNGRNTLCKRLMISSCSSSFRSILSWTPWLENGVLNQSSNVLTLLKIFGKIKLSNAQSSGKLFYIV